MGRRRPFRLPPRPPGSSAHFRTRRIHAVEDRRVRLPRTTGPHPAVRLTRPSGYPSRCATRRRTTGNPPWSLRLPATARAGRLAPCGEVAGGTVAPSARLFPSSAYCIPTTSPARQIWSQTSGAVRSTPLASSERPRVTTLMAAVVPKFVLSKQSLAHRSSSWRTRIPPASYRPANVGRTWSRATKSPVTSRQRYGPLSLVFSPAGSRK